MAGRHDRNRRQGKQRERNERNRRQRQHHARQQRREHNQRTHSSPANLASLPAEIRQRIWYYVSGYYVGQYSHQSAHAVPAPDFTNRESQGPPHHPLSRVNRNFAADGHRIWPHLGYTHLNVNSNITLLPPSVFHGIQHLTLTMYQALHVLQFTVPLLPPDWISPTPASARITLPSAPAVRKLHIHLFFRSATDLRDAALQTALWRLQAFRRQFDVTIDFITDNNPPRPRETFASLTMTNRNINLHFNAVGAWNTLLFWNAIQSYRWQHFYIRRLNSPQRQAIIGAHPYHSAAPLGWQEGHQTYFPDGTPHPTPRLPPRRIQTRPWDGPPQPDTINFSALEDLESFFTTATSQADYDSYLESLEGFFERGPRGDEDDYDDILGDLEGLFNL